MKKTLLMCLCLGSLTIFPPSVLRAQLPLPSQAQLIAQPENSPLSTSWGDVSIVSTVVLSGAERTYAYQIKNEADSPVKLIVLFAHNNSSFLASQFITGGPVVITLGPKESRSFRQKNNTVPTMEVAVQVLMIRDGNEPGQVGAGAWIYLPKFAFAFGSD